MLLSVKALSFRYQEKDHRLLKNIDFSLNAGQILTVSGKSGSGKTTLLYLLCGVIPHHINGFIEGQITISGVNWQNSSPAQLSPYVSLVMQNPAHQLFFPSVEEELAFAPENLNLSPQSIKKRIDEILSLLRINHLRQQNTTDLSYGQQKLTALAAVWTLQPQILLLDEISNGISPDRKEDIINLITQYTESGKSVILADHDRELLNLAETKLNLSS